MQGFIRYQAISYIRSLKFIPPLTVFGAWILVFYAYSGVPVMSSYAVTCLAVYLTMAWIAMSVFSLETRNLLFVQLPQQSMYFWGKWLVCLFAAVLLTGFAIGYPILIGSFKEVVQPIHLILAIYGHVILALFGISVGAFFANTSASSQKFAWLSAMLITVVSIPAEGIIEKAGWLQWILLLVPPVIRVIGYLGDSMLRLGWDFWMDILWVIGYFVVSLFVAYRMFRRKSK
ncbi:Na+/H+-dicarboxylate symporters [Bacillus sp. OxB-1]|uniref:hypothetical protein n=1 Tax=Bacillus sp. (strain OxB-1) TaxID=98228 RepID=UPI0005821DBB|nr:hypothetical protein [Bacillus sp. OxB-1]BAQ11029.1 Na+/H+-dicarboxylate symporters [Bacillus sp. OxB-1]